MIPLPLAGLAAVGSSLILKYKSGSSASQRQIKRKPRSTPKYRINDKPLSIHNPLLPMLESFRSKLIQAFKKPEVIDYDFIVRGLLPTNAKILTPQVPVNAKQHLIADIDGDAYPEIITTYQYGEEVKTVVLKQKSRTWYIAGEISHPGQSTLHYRNVASISDDDKKQLLIGVMPNHASPVLFGYSMHDGSIHPLFEKRYNKLKLISGQSGKRSSAKQQIAIWEQEDRDSYNIDVFALKDNQLQATGDITPYYSSHVIPFYIHRIKRAPYDPANWYNLARTLVDVKSYNDARIAIKVGNELDVNSRFQEKFNALKSQMDG